MVDMHLFCVQSKETDIESRAQRLKGYIICLLASIKNSKRIKKRVNSNSFEGVHIFRKLIHCLIDSNREEGWNDNIQ